MTSSCLMTKDKGVRTGEAMPTSRWDMLEGPDLILSCSKETLVAVLSLKGPAAGVGSSIWRVGSELTRASASGGSSVLSVIAVQMTYCVGVRR